MHAPTAPSTRPTRVRLHDGCWVSIRPIEPSDAAGLSGFYARLSPESRRRRFLGGRSCASADVVRAFTTPNSDGLLALAERSGEVIGHACLMRSGALEAEVAFAVADPFQGLGLGRALVSDLLVVARRCGVRRLSATMFADNEPMRHLLHTAGARATEQASAGVSEIVLEL